MPVVLAAAAVGAGATVYAANKASSTAKKAAAQNQQIIDETKQENTDLLKPYSERGNAAGDRLNAFLGLSGSTAQDRAFENYKNSTGYQFQTKSGMDAINQNAATKGLLKSGSTLKGAIKYGQNVANTYTQNYLNNLQTQQGAGLNAANALAGNNTSAATGQTANNNYLAGAQMQSANTTNNAIQNLLGNVVSAYSYGKGQSSYGSAPKTTYSGLPDGRKGPPN